MVEGDFEASSPEAFWWVLGVELCHTCMLNVELLLFYVKDS